MSQNYINNTTYPNPNYQQPIAGPNAVSINIFTPQAYGTPTVQNETIPNNNYNLYGANTQPALPIYPQNYNTMINPYAYNNNQPILNSGTQAHSKPQLMEKTENTQNQTDKDKAKQNQKIIIPLTDDYIRSLENYMNNENPKIRLIGAKDVMERFKEDENRKDNPSLTALLNKALRDTSPSVRFLALTTLQLGYSVGNDETVSILKEIQSKNSDQTGEDQLLASEILLKLSAGMPQEVKQIK